MKVVFIVSELYNGRTIPLLKEYPDYQSAEKAIANMPKGRYQIDKIFVVGEELEVVSHKEEEKSQNAISQLVDAATKKYKKDETPLKGLIY